MTTFLMFGNYSQDSIKDISSDRTVKAHSLIENNGGKRIGGYALLGETDLVLIIEFPGMKEAMKTSVELSKLLGISFTTAPAVTLDEFDQLVG